MAVKASASITLSFMVDVYASYRYYKLQASTASAPNAPTVFPPSTSSGWDDTEPSYTSGSTNTLYFVDCTVFTDDSFAYSKVSISSSYEAAKEAWNKANNAQKTADDAKDKAGSANAKIDNLEVGGRNLLVNGTLVNGYPSASTGQMASTSANFRTSDFIPLKTGETYTISWRRNSKIIRQWLGVFYYKSDKTFISCEDLQRTGDPVILTKVAPTECAYLRIYWQYSVDDKVKVEKGNKATDWTPAPEDVDNAIDDAAKTATNYMEFTEGTGLVVGDMTSDTLGKNSLIDSDGMAIRDGTTELARFCANKIELGKNNDSSKTSISLLNGYGNIDTTTVNITDVGEYKYLDIYAEKISMASQTAANNIDGYIPSIIITPDIASLRSRGAYVSANADGSVSIHSGLNNVSIEAGSVNFKTDNTSLTKNSNYRIYGGRVLYSNSSGSTGTITLNETANNFSMIEIFYGKDGQGYDSTKIFLPNGKTASLTVTNMYSTTGIQTATKLVTISGTSVTPNTSRCGYLNLDGSSFSKTGAENMIKIRYVVGYK